MGQRANSKIVDLNPTISITILTVNSLNTSIKTQRLLDGIKRQDSNICCVRKK